MTTKTKNSAATLLLIIGLMLTFQSCEKEKDYTDIDFWATGWTTEDPLEFYVDGVRVQPKFPEVVPEHRPGNLFEASSGGKESVTIDFWITYNNIVYTSIPERAEGPVSPSFSLNADESIGGSEYNISPTGDYDNPWTIVKESDDGGGITGNWVRSDGASYLKFSGSSIYLCNGTSLQEFSGTYDASANEATLVEGSTTLTFYIYPEGSDKILIEQYVSNEHVGSTYYYKSTEYPCD